MNDPEEFGRFLAAMPGSLRVSLQSGDEASTAFYLARRTGWSEQELTDDAVSRSRGGRMGPGWVITGLRNLASNAPVKAVRKTVARWKPDPFESLPQQWIDERNALLRKIREEKVPGEEAARMMETLIATQRRPGLRVVDSA